MAVETFWVRNLDGATREYLQTVKSLGAAASWGLFYDRSGFGWMLAVILGGALAGVAAFQFFQLSFFIRAPDVPGWPAVAFVVGTAVLTGGIHYFVRARRRDHLGSFYFVDARYFWNVTPIRVQVVDLAKVISVSGQHSQSNGSYTHSVLAFDRYSVRIGNKEVAEYMHGFLQALLQVRGGRAQGQIPTMPALLGREIRSLLRLSVSAEAQLADIPTPSRRSAWAIPTEFSVPFAAAAVATVYGFYFMPQDALRRKDDHFFAQIEQSKEVDSGLQAIDRYIAELPTGRRAEQVQIMRDDLKFEKARVAAAKGSAAALREYLVDGKNTRHRIEAQALLDGFYDEAIRRLQTAAKEQPTVDRGLLNALVTLVNNLKFAPTPIVTVAFSATHQATAATPEQQKREALVHLAHETRNADVRAIASGNRDKSAVLHVGDSFSGSQVDLRQRVILERLSEALGKIVHNDLLRLEAAGAKGTAHITLIYHTEPSGELYLYTQTKDGATRTKGLLRGYKIGWSIRIQAGNDKPFVRKLDSVPLNQLRMTSQPGDPEWAAYAVMLYSAFHDFSNRLIRMAGLVPPPAPNNFSFRDAAGRV